jgi:hypothetical protein
VGTAHLDPLSRKNAISPHQLTEITVGQAATSCLSASPHLAGDVTRNVSFHRRPVSVPAGRVLTVFEVNEVDHKVDSGYRIWAVNGYGGCL